MDYSDMLKFLGPRIERDYHPFGYRLRYRHGDESGIFCSPVPNERGLLGDEAIYWLRDGTVVVRMPTYKMSAKKQKNWEKLLVETLPVPFVIHYDRQLGMWFLRHKGVGFTRAGVMLGARVTFYVSGGYLITDWRA